MTKPRIKTAKKSYTFDYPEALNLTKQQLDIFWLPDEISVEKDIQDLKTNFTKSEYHGVVTVLKLFTLYETVIGNEYWGGRVMNEFPRPEIQRMASCFSFFEINVHAPFYNKLNEVLGLATDEFYSDYVNDPILKERMAFIDKMVSDPDDLLSLAVFSIIEGAILYSSFAFLKHFQTQGKNKLVNVCAGINFSVRDEDLHATGGAWLYRQLFTEKNPDQERKERLEKKIYTACEQIFEHEAQIIDKIFERGKIENITDTQLKHFVQSRIDLCLERLGMEKLYKPKYNPVADWFYDNINGGKFHDFFVKTGSEYNRDWQESQFSW